MDTLPTDRMDWITNYLQEKLELFQYADAVWELNNYHFYSSMKKEDSVKHVSQDKIEVTTKSIHSENPLLVYPNQAERMFKTNTE